MTQGPPYEAGSYASKGHCMQQTLIKHATVEQGAKSTQVPSALVSTLAVSVSAAMAQLAWMAGALPAAARRACPRPPTPGHHNGVCQDGGSTLANRLQSLQPAGTLAAGRHTCSRPTLPPISKRDQTRQLRAMSPSPSASVSSSFVSCCLAFWREGACITAAAVQD
jgi:hypothetical protein